MNGITYNRFNSPYTGDKTKDCALSVTEMDNNFYVLEGRDITSVEVNGDELIINLLNGDRISNKDAFNSFAKNLGFDFDADKGILTVTFNDDEYQICGFATSGEVAQAMEVKCSTDETIIGDGSSVAPMGAAPTYKTGQYRPVKGIIENCGCNCGKNKKSLPKDAKAGDRYVTSEKTNDYGFLYPFEGVKKMLCDLKEAGYEWDLPTKADWDNMLNAIEPRAEWANHNEVTTHKYLGKKAGQFLKSREGWKLEDTYCEGSSDSEYDSSNCDCGCNCADSNYNPCFSQPVCGEQGACKEPQALYPNRGIDAYGFDALPAGYADEEKNYMYYSERAYFWTKTNSGYGAYIKRMDYDSSKVYQDTMDLDCYASVRLVKKYNGYNFRGAEEIFGESYPVVMIPSKDGGQSLWTTINIQLNNRCYDALAIPVEEIECVTRYYINEWNGKEWVKNILKEGESVVVVNAPNEKISEEYRIIGGVLTRANDVIFNDVMDAVGNELDKLEEGIHLVNERVLRLENRVDAVEEGLENEIERAMEEERRISAALEQETTDRINEDNRISAALEKEVEDRIAVDNQQWEAIANEATIRETEDNRISAALEQETNDRITVDNQQWEAITNEATLRENEDNRISAALEKEVEDRIAVDNQQWEAITNEATIRENEDNRISAALEKEVEDRITVDNQQWEVINNEIARAIAREDEIEAQVPNEGAYNEETGVLTLSRNDETKFEVQFSFDFGKFEL